MGSTVFTRIGRDGILLPHQAEGFTLAKSLNFGRIELYPYARAVMPDAGSCSFDDTVKEQSSVSTGHLKALFRLNAVLLLRRFPSCKGNRMPGQSLILRSSTGMK